MAKVNMVFNPKTNKNFTHDEVAAAIKVRALIVDYNKAQMTKVIFDEFRKYVTDAELRTKMLAAGLKFEPALPKDCAGEWELYIFVKDKKSTKINLTIESPDQGEDFLEAFPLFANAGSAKITKDGYFGGGADEPHVHVYGNSAHLKLGNKRFNLVQNGTLYKDGVAKAHSALQSHGLKTTLAPWCAAALAYLG